LQKYKLDNKRQLAGDIQGLGTGFWIFCVICQQGCPYMLSNGKIYKAPLNPKYITFMEKIRMWVMFKYII